MHALLGKMTLQPMYYVHEHFTGTILDGLLIGAIYIHRADVVIVHRLLARGYSLLIVKVIACQVASGQLP